MKRRRRRPLFPLQRRTIEDAAKPLANGGTMADEERQLGSSDFGTLLRRFRLAAGLSQEMLAERAGLSANGIGALERGYRRAPQRETLALIVRALGLGEHHRHDLEASAGSRRTVVRGSTPNLQKANATFLPLSLTEFVGREEELGAIAGLVCEHRLVTIAGAGGIGKTQTALRAVASLEAGRTSNVRFIGLAPLADPGLVVSAIAASCGVKEVLHQPLLERVVASLRSHPVLLILDNCEHVVAEAARVAEVLLTSCPELRILATSREPLRSAGEHTYRLPSLTREDAVALFVARARAADHRFALDDANASAVS
ncbi:MAG: helix-turn-helix domain-containing protein [Candidatus Cybelea sp.]